MKTAVILLLGVVVATVTCQKPWRGFSQPEELYNNGCNSDYDCGEGCCCFSGHMMASKRQTGFGFGGSYCQPLSQLGENCNVYSSCGCVSGTYCHQIEGEVEDWSRLTAFRPLPVERCVAA